MQISTVSLDANFTLAMFSTRVEDSKHIGSSFKLPVHSQSLLIETYTKLAA